MLKVPNYDVVVPTVPTVRLETKKRTTTDADRNELVHEFVADSDTIVELPWNPVSTHWVEVYVDGIRLINPLTGSQKSGQIFESYNVVGRIVKFNQPLTGQIKIICDTAATHHWRSLVIGAQNVQAFYETKQLYDFRIKEWPIYGGQAVGTNYRVNYKPGPDFLTNSYVIISGCEPKKFNGNFLVKNSTEGTVFFDSSTSTRVTMTKKGVISGFGNLKVNSMTGISLYSEPVVLTQPYHGYVRLTTDRKSMAYIPDKNYVGNDTFSWTLITQHGQIGDPKCCIVKVNVI